MDRKIIQLQMERLSISRDEAEDVTASPRLQTLDAKIGNLKRQQQNLKNRWDEERAGVNKLQEIKNKIDQTNQAIAKAEREYDYEQGMFMCMYICVNACVKICYYYYCYYYYYYCYSL